MAKNNSVISVKKLLVHSWQKPFTFYKKKY